MLFGQADRRQCPIERMATVDCNISNMSINIYIHMFVENIFRACVLHQFSCRTLFIFVQILNYNLFSKKFDQDY